MYLISAINHHVRSQAVLYWISMLQLLMKAYPTTQGLTRPVAILEYNSVFNSLAPLKQVRKVWVVFMLMQ